MAVPKVEIAYKVYEGNIGIRYKRGVYVGDDYD